MDGIFLWLMGGVAALLLVAALVAGWEHLRRSVRPQDEFTSATPRSVSVDVRLDKLTARPPQAATVAAAATATTAAGGSSDIGQRRAALDEVLARMAQPPADTGLAAAADSGFAHDGPRNWADTTPMVGPGQLTPEEAKPAGAARRREFSASQQP